MITIHKQTQIHCLTKSQLLLDNLLKFYQDRKHLDHMMNIIFIAKTYDYTIYVETYKINI
jgi:hypothetical protein